MNGDDFKAIGSLVTEMTSDDLTEIEADVSLSFLHIYFYTFTSCEFVVFVNKIQVQANKVCYKVSLCENFQRQSCSRTIPLSYGI